MECCKCGRSFDKSPLLSVGGNYYCDNCLPNPMGMMYHFAKGIEDMKKVLLSDDDIIKLKDIKHYLAINGYVGKASWIESVIDRIEI